MNASRGILTKNEKCRDFRRGIVGKELDDSEYLAYTAKVGEMDMVLSLPMPPPGFDALTVEEQIDYVQSLWDHIAAHPEQVPVPDWHRQILAERLASYRANPNEGKTWEEVEKAIIEELNRQSE